METHLTQRRERHLPLQAFVFIFVALTCVLAHPSQALASDCYVKDASGNVTYYDHFEDGKKAAYGKGKVLVMTCDLSTDTTIGIDGGKELTIDMNGHAVRVDKITTASVFHLYPNSSVTFTSSRRDVEFKCNVQLPGYDHTRSDWSNLVAGGVISTGSNTYGIQGGGVYMEEGSHLTLDGVLVVGNWCHSSSNHKSRGGGVYMEKNCTLDLKNSASICYNRTMDYGGGVYIDGDNCTVTLDNASIRDNGGGEYGGGVFSDGSGTKIKLLNGSSIYGNEAEAGGGVYFNKSMFSITSPDKTGSVSSNTSYLSNRAVTKGGQSGGGIHVDQKSGENEGLIENLTISGNYSAYDGGAIELDQQWTTIRNCTITGNTSGCEGGAIYVCNSKNIIDNCTIMNNACDLANKGYEGGGVFVWHDYDIRLSNVCVIKGNTRGKGTTNYDDIMLRENGGATAKAYIIGNLKEGSAVGVRTGTTGDRRVAKNFSYANKSCLFADLDGYYVSFGTDAGGDAWQRHNTIEYTSTINGANVSRHKANSTVTLAAPAAAGKTFWYWGTEGVTGLTPIEYYINGSTMYNPILTLKMPQNDINVTTVYADTVEKVEISGLKVPVVGEELVTTATLTRSDGKKSGGTDPVEAKVTWYKVRADGTSYAVSGKAEAGDTYYAVIAFEQSTTAGRFFNASMAAADVTLRLGSGDGEQAAAPASAKVDATTGTLTVQTANFSLPKPEEAEKPSGTTKTASAEILRQWEDAVKKAKEKYQKKDKDEGSSEETDKDTGEDSSEKTDKGEETDKDTGEGTDTDTGDGTGKDADDETESQLLALANETDDEESSDRGEIDSVQFEYTYDESDEENAIVTITAPNAEGYSFSYWEGVPDGWESDDKAGTVTVSATKLNEFTESGRKLKAIYSPAVTKLDIALDAPVAGTKLAETCGEIKVTSYNAGEPVSLSKDGGFKVTWSPEAETAAYGTTYTALIEICDADGADSIDASLIQNIVVTCNDTTATSAGFVVTDGKLCLALAFPATKQDAVASVTAPSNVELSFEEAAGYATEQLNYTDEVCWPLPRTVAVTLASGQVVDGDVVWDIPDGFDANATAAQELHVKGYVYHIATGEDAEIDTDEDLLEVEATIKVAAPEKESDNSGKKENENTDDKQKNNEQDSSGDSSRKVPQSKESLPSTGDTTTVTASAVLLAASAICLAGAWLSRRNHA